MIAYIAEDIGDAAARFAQAIFQSIERLAQFPESGRMVPEFEDPMIREVIRKPCRIVYRIDPKSKTVEIARVWHARRGIPEI